MLADMRLIESKSGPEGSDVRARYRGRDLVYRVGAAGEHFLIQIPRCDCIVEAAEPGRADRLQEEAEIAARPAARDRPAQPRTHRRDRRTCCSRAESLDHVHVRVGAVADQQVRERHLAVGDVAMQVERADDRHRIAQLRPQQGALQRVEPEDLVMIRSLQISDSMQSIICSK